MNLYVGVEIDVYELGKSAFIANVPSFKNPFVTPGGNEPAANDPTLMLYHAWTLGWEHAEQILWLMDQGFSDPDYRPQLSSKRTNLPEPIKVQPSKSYKAYANALRALLIEINPKCSVTKING